MRTILAWRRDEFVIAAITAVVVVVVGVGQGMVLVSTKRGRSLSPGR